MLLWHIHVLAFVWTYVIIYPGMKLLGLMVPLGLLLLETARLFFKVAAPLYIPPVADEGSEVLHPCQYLLLPVL